MKIDFIVCFLGKMKSSSELDGCGGAPLFTSVSCVCREHFHLISCTIINGGNTLVDVVVDVGGGGALWKNT